MIVIITEAFTAALCVSVTFCGPLQPFQWPSVTFMALQYQYKCNQKYILIKRSKQLRGSIQWQIQGRGGGGGGERVLSHIL